MKLKALKIAHTEETMEQQRWMKRSKDQKLKEKEDLKSKNNELCKTISNLEDKIDTQVLVYFTYQICLLFTNMADV